MLQELFKTKPTKRAEEYVVNSSPKTTLSRTIITTKLYDPLKQQVLLFEYIIGKFIELHPEDFYEPHGKQIAEDAPIACELREFRSDKKEQDGIYLVMRVFDEEGNELPLFEGLLILGDASAITYANDENLYSFYREIESEMKDLVYEGRVDNTYSYQRFHSLHYIGDSINEFYSYATERVTDGAVVLNSNREAITIPSKQYAYEYILPEFHEHEEFVEGIIDPSLKKYIRSALDTFYLDATSKKLISRCENCSDFFQWRKNKRYCSTECRRSVANRNNYKKRQKNTEKS